MVLRSDSRCLEQLYAQYNRRHFVHPDPLEFLYDYPELRDREVVGLIASCLAYGRVRQILKSLGQVLALLGDRPADFILGVSKSELQALFSGFKHRFTTGGHLAALLHGASLVIKDFGSLENCLVDSYLHHDESIIPALSAFVRKIRQAGGLDNTFLLPDPEKGSACKRLFLYLRWMVRSDEVDPGGWSGIPASALLVPLDTHMYYICSNMGFTSRKQPDLKTAIEITERFQAINACDPVKYDFVLTRFGIREELDRNSLTYLLPSRPLL